MGPVIALDNGAVIVPGYTKLCVVIILGFVKAAV